MVLYGAECILSHQIQKHVRDPFADGDPLYRAVLSLQEAPDNLEFRAPSVLDPLPIDITKSPHPRPPPPLDFG